MDTETDIKRVNWFKTMIMNSVNLLQNDKTNPQVKGGSWKAPERLIERL
jgi:hypothetical protein